MRIIVLLLLANVAPAQTPPGLLTIQVPGAGGTQVNGINSAGDVVGSYADSATEKAFLRRANGTFVTFQVPGAVWTQAHGINDNGEIVGRWEQHAFLRKADGTIQSLDIPGYDVTHAFAIDNAGRVAGMIRGGVEWRAFLREPNGTVATIVIAGLESVSAITSDGTILGHSATGDFLRTAAGAISFFTIAPAPGVSAQSWGLNNAGFLAGNTGTTQVPAFNQEVYVGRSSGDGVRFPLPGISNYGAHAINSAGQVAGSYQVNNQTSGFLLNPCAASTVTPLTKAHGSAAEPGGITVQPQTSPCLWLAEPLDSWIEIVQGSAGWGAGAVQYRLAANTGAARQGRIRVAGQEVTITQSPGTCTYTLGTTSLAVPSSGGDGPIGVTTQQGCAWTAHSLITWAPFRIDSGTGSGQAILSIDTANADIRMPSPVSVAGQTVTITQGDCFPFVFSADRTQNVTAAGGVVNINVIGNASCIWEARPDAPWLTINSGGRGPGSATLAVRVEANPSAASRTGKVRMGVSVDIEFLQAGNPCSYSLSANTSQLGPAGGGGTFGLTAAQSSCAWNVTTDANWITVTSASSGAGSATIGFTVSASAAARQGTIRVAGLTFTVIQTAQAGTSSGFRFVPLPPCRIADTREPLFVPAITGLTSRDFNPRTSLCGVPVTAAAYSLNVTAVPKTASLGFVTVWPAGQSRPNASTLNAWDGRVVANAAIIPAGTNGAISVFASDTTDAILDINGYFVPPGDPAGLVFYPLPPCRIADTRLGSFPTGLGSPKLTGQTKRDFDLLASNCGIPAAAKAYSLNVTVVPQSVLYYLTIWPTGQFQPLASTLNSYNGQVVANAAVVPAGTGGKVSLIATNDTEVILDINGYFAPFNTGGLAYYPVTPCRVADTRAAAGFSGAFGAPALTTGAARSFPVPNSACAVPAAGAYALNFTAVPTAALGYLSTGPAGSAQPNVSTLNSWDGQVVANMALVPSGTAGAIGTWVSGSTELVLDITGYFQP